MERKVSKIKLSTLNLNIWHGITRLCSYCYSLGILNFICQDATNTRVIHHYPDVSRECPGVRVRYSSQYHGGHKHHYTGHYNQGLLCWLAEMKMFHLFVNACEYSRENLNAYQNHSLVTNKWDCKNWPNKAFSQRNLFSDRIIQVTILSRSHCSSICIKVTAQLSKSFSPRHKYWASIFSDPESFIHIPILASFV